MLAWLQAFIGTDLLVQYGPRLLHGLQITIELVLISICCGIALALPLALARLSKSRLLRGLSLCYVQFFRGTPLLAQLFLIYYGAGQFRPALQSIDLWWFFRDAFNCAALSLTLNTAGYQAEIYRGAIRSVARGQHEAAYALGISRSVAFWRVILPQAAVVALRPLGNEVILMIKGSAVASVVTVFDIMGETRLGFARSFDMRVYLYAAVLYLVLVEILRRIWDRLEARLTRYLRRSDRTEHVERAVTQAGPATH
ncbi:amino acid ABC transporter membrane protein 2, PAAT family [Faunimonas pinastri]|uniref:Amino acid ABC transporter membrane protein 2, PAAT family n=1 Tax=Faunimonas pinastri TaxID=1855383 RepID=A0A1H9JHW2_9HYPH|nr:ABC transporter permease [Faunimonas pinastri]SEQ86145.1 amino acid ABC transporter membrane protein 2, PAAT family [Faunimonas pinastri]